MRVLVTGAGGFLGRHLCAELLGRGHQVVGVGRTPAPSVQIVHDLADSPLGLTTPFDSVAHLAAVLPQPDASDYETNARIVEHSCSPQIADAYHLLVSSVSVYPYGAIPEVPMPAGGIVSSCNSYGESKKQQELVLEDFARGPRGIVRPSSIYGQGMAESTVLPIMMKFANERAAISVLGPSQYTQSFVHVRDLARLCAVTLERGESCLLHGFGERSVTMAELANCIAEAAPHEVAITDQRVDDESRAGHGYPDRIEPWRHDVETTTLERGVAQWQQRWHE